MDEGAYPLGLSQLVVERDSLPRLPDVRCDAPVFSKGFHERLGVTPETLRTLEDRGVAAHVRQTGEAISLYNELRDTERVGALIHSTC